MSDQLREINKLMVLSNRLSEIHILNLKTYPKVFFDNVGKVEIKYDFTPPPPGEKSEFPGGIVAYYIDLKEEPKDLDKRCTHLERAVKNLFWDDTEVEIVLRTQE